MQKWKVYISSTFRDLKDFRSELRSYFEKQVGNNFELCKIMEKMFDDGTFTSLEKECVKAVESCDIYILILANKVGSFPLGSSRTYTEIELDTAINSEKKIFCFLLEPFNQDEIDNHTKHQEILAKLKGRPTHLFKDSATLKLAFLESLIQFASQSPVNKKILIKVWRHSMWKMVSVFLVEILKLKIVSRKLFSITRKPVFP